MGGIISRWCLGRTAAVVAAGADDVEEEAASEQSPDNTDTPLDHTYRQQTCLWDVTYKMKELVKVLMSLSTCVNTEGLTSHSQDAGWL